MGTKACSRVTMTPAFSISSIQNAMLSVRPPGSSPRQTWCLFPFWKFPSSRVPGREHLLLSGTDTVFCFQRYLEVLQPALSKRQEHAKVDLASQFAERCDHIRPAYQKLSLCACNIEGFGKTENHPISFAPGVAKKLPPKCPVKIISLYALS